MSIRLADKVVESAPHNELQRARERHRLYPHSRMFENLSLAELLKATGPKTVAVAAACFILLLGNERDWFPIKLDPLVLGAAVVLGVFAGCLAAASLAVFVVKALSGPYHWGRRRWAAYQHTRQFLRDLPHFTKEERETLGYLLLHNQKTFTCADDGGYAAALLGRGYIVRMLTSGQPFNVEDMPVGVPEHIWKTLNRHNADLTKGVDKDGRYPWRVPWQLR
jgi:hypothetical protein